MESNNKIVMFVVAMCIVVAGVLAGMYTVLKPIADRNEEIFNKRNILKAIETKLDGSVAEMSDDEVLNLFQEKVTQITLKTDGTVVAKKMPNSDDVEGDGPIAEKVDMKQEKKKADADKNLPLFIYESSEGKNYIVSVRGNGLWDEIWGYIALESDVNTIAGATFDHVGETPGLGAEIKDNQSWVDQFKGEQIYNAAGEYVSVEVKKGGAAPDDKNAVDGISGATVTANGVDEMLDRGIEYYMAYFETIK